MNRALIIWWEFQLIFSVGVNLATVFWGLITLDGKLNHCPWNSKHFFSCSLRDRGKVFPLCTWEPIQITLSLHARELQTGGLQPSRPAYLTVENLWWGGGGLQQPCHQSQQCVCCFGPAGCDGNEKESAALGDRTPATPQGEANPRWASE